MKKQVFNYLKESPLYNDDMVGPLHASKKIAGYDPETKTKTFTPHLNRVDAQDNKEQEERDGARLFGRVLLVGATLTLACLLAHVFDVSIDLVEIVKWF